MLSLTLEAEAPRGHLSGVDASEVKLAQRKAQAARKHDEVEALSSRFKRVESHIMRQVRHELTARLAQHVANDLQTVSHSLKIDGSNFSEVLAVVDLLGLRLTDLSVFRNKISSDINDRLKKARIDLRSRIEDLDKQVDRCMEAREEHQAKLQITIVGELVKRPDLRPEQIMKLTDTVLSQKGQILVEEPRTVKHPLPLPKPIYPT